MRKVAFRNLGCKVNEYELEFMQQKMAESGFEVVPFDTKSDVYVVNTCTVTNIADRKSRQMLHQAKKRNPDAVVVAVGCYVETDRAGAEADASIDLCVGVRDKNRLPELILQYLDSREENGSTSPASGQAVLYEDMLVTKTAEHTRAYMKIEDGCNQFCSYCAIPLARGRVRSRSLAQIRKEAEALAQNGYREVVLTGIHLSSYGLERRRLPDGGALSYNEAAKDGGYTNTDLLEVIRILQETEGIYRIRLGSLEPRLITEPFLRELCKNDKLCPHFHLSLQSGCDETLKRMNRHYTTGEYAERVRLLRAFYEHPGLTTDVIVGFPGESDGEFERTREFLEEIGFSRLHIFKYSKRRNTPAAAMKNQVPDEIKGSRSDVLLKLSEALSERFCSYYIGKKAEILFEEQKDGLWMGYTREYAPAALATAIKEPASGEIQTATAVYEKDGILYFQE